MPRERGELGFDQSEGVEGLDDERLLALLTALKTPAVSRESEGRRRCEEHRAFVDDKLQQGVRLTKIHRLLGRQGVFVSYSTLYRFAVEELDFGKNAAPVPVVEGTPQGGPLSPLLSNIVLDELDRELSRRGHRFVRYADDCNVYVRSERSGQRVMQSLTDFIERRMKLKVNRHKSAVAKPQERKFLGFRLHRLKAGPVRVLIAPESWRRLRAKLKELTPRLWGQSLGACIKRIGAYLRGWIGYYGICDGKQRSTLGTEDAHLRRRLRAIVEAGRPTR